VTQSRWATWHESYADPESDLSRRLTYVQRRFRDGLDTAPAGPLSVISLCAGEGRDVLGVLPAHPRRDDVSARLVEIDPEIAAKARAVVVEAGLERVEVVAGDAALVSAYVGLAPADVVLACGIFGNVPETDIRNTIARLPALCRPGATVLWTRHRRAPDLTPAIRSWFADADFDEIGFDYEDGRRFAVGAHRFQGVTPALDPTIRLFTFESRSAG
jgi:hypothetical protein